MRRRLQKFLVANVSEFLQRIENMEYFWRFKFFTLVLEYFMIFIQQVALSGTCIMHICSVKSDFALTALEGIYR